MRHCPYNLWNCPPRVIAALLAALCLWMGSGGVLHHTDELGEVASLAHRAAVGHLTPQAPADVCAACEWTQGLQTGATPLLRVPPPLHCPLAFLPPFAPHLLARPMLARAARAPPAVLS